MEGRSNQAKFGRFSNGSKSQASLASVSKVIQNHFSRTHNRLQFKGTEAEFKGTESAEDMQLPILNPNGYLPVFPAPLSLYKEALKQLRSTRKEHTLARVLTIENYLEL